MAPFLLGLNLFAIILNSGMAVSNFWMYNTWIGVGYFCLAAFNAVALVFCVTELKDNHLRKMEKLKAELEEAYRNRPPLQDMVDLVVEITDEQ